MISDLEIALAAISDAKADAEFGFVNSPERKAARDAEKQRLKADYEANGDNSEVGKALKRDAQSH